MDKEYENALFEEFGYKPKRYTGELTAAQLLDRMEARGITGRKLARAARLSPASISAIMRGRQSCGKYRRERIENAIALLGLDREAEAPARERAVAGLKFRISVL